ncbi:unnamed protein product [Callosobruchus maculatus]|uniref:protein-tyrosine-phosphatase n=1 Tax=Callosobruchus maculatus TaxID=64391 RepID=A0A653CN51_CALMS|nr:unnamed protein product [Callosobruchus maculatus]
MPFKLKLKKSRHYSVVSKSLFVISVEILDGTSVECTLSSESTGQDCLDVVCQKLGLNQPKFFGLQYVSRNGENNLSWLELDRPIKRQLDKYARGLYVHLRVMYYVISGVKLLNDEVTRYHYFLQLKQDVIEGRIACTPQQAVELAGYSMQAEFGNFDAERHTAHYLKDFQLFPRNITDATLLAHLTEAASRRHAALQGLPHGTAEECYICACQRLGGYGQETYAVKEVSSSAEAVLGICLTGVYVSVGGESRHFGWSDISNVINHKKDFTIETVGGNEKVEFQFGDIESAKNAWRFCVLQHVFYRQYEMDNAGEQGDKNNQQLPLFQQNELRQMDSYDDVIAAVGNTGGWDRQVSSSLQTLGGAHRAQSTSCLDLNRPTPPSTADIDTLRSLLPSYRPAPDYETAIQQKYRNSSGAIPTREPLRATQPYLYSSQPEIHQTEAAYAAHLHYPDVTHNNIEQKNLLYRGSGFGQSQVLAGEGRYLDSMGVLHVKHPPPYPSNKIGSNSTPDLAGMSQHIKPHGGFINSIVSGSSPDLVSSGGAYHLLRSYNTAVRQVAPLAHPVHRSHSYLPTVQQQHGTYENLAQLVTPAAYVDSTRHIRKVFDDRGNVVYCVQPHGMTQIPGAPTGYVMARNQTLVSPHENSAEPIYENVPLPIHFDEGSEMRARTQSVNSAPEIGGHQAVNRTVVDAVQLQMEKLDVSNSSRHRTDSKENLYANIDHTPTVQNVQSSRTELNHNFQHNHQNLEHQSPTISTPIPPLTDSNSNLTRSSQNLDTSRITPLPTDISSTIDTNSILNVTNSTSVGSSYIERNAGLSETSRESYMDASSASNASSNKSKKKRWGILVGRSKSGEKVKSATLGREKRKEDKNQANNKHRWSTGLPRFNPLPPSISKETMCQLLESKLADSQLYFEFDKIPKKKQNADFKTALHPDNAIFNRFKEILPYEDNRLRLTPSKSNKFGYINASHITATVGSKQRFYIAAQGPTKQTLPYFWQCVWEAEVYMMVQLTDPTEDIMYLPDADERCIDIDSDYQIWWEFSQKTGHCVTSKIRLCHVSSRRYRTIWHLHYTDWAEQGCPQSAAHFLGFLEETQSVHQHSLGEIPPGHNKNPPILVHCTAGVGRTGLTILCDLLLYTVDHNQEVCIPRVVDLLRQQRAYMIQTIAQYRFVYVLLIHYLKQTRLI